MLRAVLLGSLAIAPLACGSHDAAPAAQPGAPAGQVVKVAGTVTAQRGSAARRLAQGDTVAADELIDTGSDGSVSIRLARNHVVWQVGPGQHERPDESTAWSLPTARTPAASAELDTAAAGRPAERQAADTSATAPVGAATGASAPPPHVEAPHREAIAAPEAKKDRIPAPAAAPRAHHAMVPAKRAAPPPADDDAMGAPAASLPGAPSPRAAAAPPAAPSSGGAALGPTTGAPPAKAGIPHARQDALAQLLAQHLADLRACLSATTPTIQITLDVDASGRVTRQIRGDAAAQRCVQRVLDALKLPPGKVTLDVK